MFAFLLSPLLQTYAAASTACAKPTFLGLVPWYQYLNAQRVYVIDSAGNTLKDSAGKALTECKILNFDPVNGTQTVLGSGSPFLLIALAILDDLVRLAALVAVGFIIYGGIEYITSQGSPDSTKKAQQTIINALIGLLVAVIAAALVGYIGNKLGGIN